MSSTNYQFLQMTRKQNNKNHLSKGMKTDEPKRASNIFCINEKQILIKFVIVCLLPAKSAIQFNGIPYFTIKRFCLVIDILRYGFKNVEIEKIVILF